MSMPIPVDLWRRLCAHLATYETCQITIHQHQGRVCKIDLQVSVKALRDEEGCGARGLEARALDFVREPD